MAVLFGAAHNHSRNMDNVENLAAVELGRLEGWPIHNWLVQTRECNFGADV
jgi:hypothetical protein